ncbi:MAG: zinc ribbon domain-containing protein [Muribaculaceae bacterium]|nr:zinc ribbon domain-containing protein [Muribaculaceae bacterium]
MQEFECPKCHNMIPASAVFCPVCGSMARDDMHEKPQSKPASALPSYDAPFPVDANQNTPTAQNNVEQSQNQTNNMPKENFRTRNILIACLLVIFAILFIVSNVFYSTDSKVGRELTDSVPANDNSNLEELIIFKRALQDNGLMTDGAIPAYAIRVARNDKNNAERIVGVTSKTNTLNGVAFFKIYTLERNNGSAWEVEGTPITKNFNDRMLDFSTKNIMADNNTVPQSTTINGKNYFFFAYSDFPVNDNNENARVTLALFNVDNQDLKLFNFGGSIKLRGGQKLVYGRLAGESGSQESRFAQSQAERIKLIYIPTPEELEAERLAQEEAELNEPDRADDKWAHDNEENLDDINSGNEVEVKTKTYDTPIFNIKESKKSINNDNFTVVLGNNGNVYGFNKATRKYYVINGSGKATDIGFASDSGSETTLNIKTATGRIVYNLSTDRARQE